MASETNLTSNQAAARAETGGKTVFKILLAISFCHFLNATVQSLLPAIYPILRTSFHLNLGQIGLIALTSQVTASLLQPLVGLYTDRRPQPYSLAVGMGITLIGLLAFSMAPSFGYSLAPSLPGRLSVVRWAIRSAASLSSGVPFLVFFRSHWSCRTPTFFGPPSSAW